MAMFNGFCMFTRGYSPTKMVLDLQQMEVPQIIQIQVDHDFET